MLERFATEQSGVLPDLSFYLRSTRPSQSVVRLLEHPDNEQLRRSVRIALGNGPELMERLDRLPTRVRAALES